MAFEGLLLVTDVSKPVRKPFIITIIYVIIFRHLLLFSDSANIIRRFERLTQVKYDISKISHNLKLFGWVTNVRRFPRQEAMCALTFFNIMVKKKQLTLTDTNKLENLEFVEYSGFRL